MSYTINRHFSNPRSDLVSEVFPELEVDPKERITVSQYMKKNSRDIKDDPAVNNLFISLAKLFPISYFPYLPSHILLLTRNSAGVTYKTKVPFLVNGVEFRQIAVRSSTWRTFYHFFTSDAYKRMHMANFSVDIGLFLVDFVEKYGNVQMHGQALIDISAVDISSMSLEEIEALPESSIASTVVILENPVFFDDEMHERLAVNPHTVRLFYRLFKKGHQSSIFSEYPAMPHISDLGLQPKYFMRHHAKAFASEENQARLIESQIKYSSNLLRYLPRLTLEIIKSQQTLFRFKTKNKMVIINHLVPKNTEVDLNTLEFFWDYFSLKCHVSQLFIDSEEFLENIGLTIPQMLMRIYNEISRNPILRKYIIYRIRVRNQPELFSYLPTRSLAEIDIVYKKNDVMIVHTPGIDCHENAIAIPQAINPRTVQVFGNIFDSSEYKEHLLSDYRDMTMTTTEVYQKFRAEFEDGTFSVERERLKFLSPNDPEDIVLFSFQEILKVYRDKKFSPELDHPTIYSVVPQRFNGLLLKNVKIDFWILLAHSGIIYSPEFSNEVSDEELERKLRSSLARL